jgi:hypothetical protein
VLLARAAGKSFAALPEALDSGEREPIRRFFSMQFGRHIPWPVSNF